MINHIIKQIKCLWSKINLLLNLLLNEFTKVVFVADSRENLDNYLDERYI